MWYMYVAAPLGKSRERPDIAMVALVLCALQARSFLV